MGSRVHGAASACLVTVGLFLCGLGGALAIAEPSTSSDLPHGSSTDDAHGNGQKPDSHDSSGPKTGTEKDPQTADDKPGNGENPGNGNVYYCRTTNWDLVSVGGNRPETVNFTLNHAVTPGRYELTVVGAGIASRPVPIRIRAEELVANDDEAAAAQLSAASSTVATAPSHLMRVLKPVHPRH